MSILQDQLRVATVSEMLQLESLRIPTYQRPYSWTPASAVRLVDDALWAMQTPPAGTDDRPDYPLGAVVLYRPASGEDVHEVVDGQQRLLTLTMLLALLNAADQSTPEEEGDAPLVKARNALRRRIRRLDPALRAELAAFIKNHCTLVVVVTDDRDEAFRFFDAQNYRGKPLEAHDLLKSYHLRQMNGASDAVQVSVVEQWERTPNEDLKELFAIYLSRIARWSRGQDAMSFSVKDREFYEGIAVADGLVPVTEYHAAAQASLPLLRSWSSSADRTNGQRARFQLDAPVVAGEPFFEMVNFTLEQVRWLKTVAFGGTTEAELVVGPLDLRAHATGSRHQYLAPLFLTALLYYTNKFGEADLGEARDKLFSWAYRLRLDYQRVTLRSVNNYAKEGGTVADPHRHLFQLFSSMRDQLTGTSVLTLDLDPLPERHEVREADRGLYDDLAQLMGAEA